MSTTSEEIEHFSDEDEAWLSDLETRAVDLENELSVWREARQRALAEQEYYSEPVADPPHVSFRRSSESFRRAAEPDPERGPRTPVHTAARRAADRTRPRETGRTRADERTRALLDHGRRTGRRGRFGSRRRLTIWLVFAAVGVLVIAVIILRPRASWPSSVAVVKNEISTACQNPNVVSEPNQVNFACDKATNQILWVFSLMTSGDNPSFNDAKTGRQGLEPISPTQGGAVAWSLNLHHPYNPDNPIDSLEVAARAINNIIGGASLTASNGQPSVQAGLESNPANCARYTGSAALVTRAGYPSICASAVTSASGQAALVADVFEQWSVGASPVFAQYASVLFENANDPGNAQVQAILKSMFGPGA